MHSDQSPAFYPGVLIDPKTQQIAGLDPASLARFKELPQDFNMSDLAAVYDDVKKESSACLSCMLAN